MGGAESNNFSSDAMNKYCYVFWSSVCHAYCVFAGNAHREDLHQSAARQTKIDEVVVKPVV